jgi:outer membrane protein OmpA-like peptidoglycan-associated protein
MKNFGLFSCLWLVLAINTQLWGQTALETARAFVGEWHGNWGRVKVFPTNTTKIKGIFDYCDGELEGEAFDGGTIAFNWIQKKAGCAPRGKCIVKLSADRTTFSGTWGHHESTTDGGTWDGKRPGTLQAQDITDRGKRTVIYRGQITDSKTGKPISATVHFLPDGKKQTLQTNAKEDGYYQFKLTDDQIPTSIAAVKLIVHAPGYFSSGEEPGGRVGQEEIVFNFNLTPLKTGETILLNHIQFDGRKATLRPDSYTELDRLVDLLKENTTMKIRIDGHTDNAGGAVEYHQKLSEARVQTVIEYLKKAGIAPDRLSGKGWGSSNPLVPNDSPENSAKNRRVEFTIISI